MYNKLINDILKPFSLNHATLFDTIAVRVKEHGLSLDEFYVLLKDDIEAKKNQIIADQKCFADKKNTQAKKPARKSKVLCPICGFPMVIEPVNTKKCNKIGGEFTHIEICSESENRCQYTNLIINRG